MCRCELKSMTSSTHFDPRQHLAIDLNLVDRVSHRNLETKEEMVQRNFLLHQALSLDLILQEAIGSLVSRCRQSGLD